MAAPLNLVPLYPYEKSISLFSVEYALPVILVVVITFICLRIAAKHKIWASVWVYYVITLLPVLGLVQAGSQSMADRYTYLPSLGPFVALGAFAAQAWEKAGALPRWSPFLRVASGAITVVLFISLSLLTRAQTDIWKDSISLWSYVIEKEPGKVPRAYHNRANAFYKMGLPDRAVADYEKAITLNPSLYEAYANLGVLYGNAGLTDKAIRSFDMSLAINPSYPYGYCNRGITYAIIGEYGMALRDFNRAIELNANYARAYYSRGNLYLRTGRREFAAPDFEKACILGSQNGCRALRTAGT
jgi:tetratricopeptide (TPR) repeat protein